jgi:hypothetical protein
LKADPDFELIGMTPKLFLHRKRRMNRTLRMVLVGGRRAEECENSITGGLGDIAVVAMDGCHHQLQYRVDQRARLLRIKVACQLSRALNVREERGDGLALTICRERSIGLLCRDANIGSL